MTIRAVIPQQLSCGNAADARDPKVLAAHQIAAVLDVAAEEAPACLPRDRVSIRIPLADSGDNSPEQLRLALSVAASLLSSGLSTLILLQRGT